MRIKHLRQVRGLTQQALADKVKVHRVYVAQVEALTKLPSLSLLARIAKALRVSPAELLK